MKSVEDRCNEVMNLLDQLGDPDDLSIPQWVDLLELVRDEIDSRLEAARCDLERQED